MTVKQIEQQVKKLHGEGLLVFREWFRRYDNDLWDRQIERDVRTGRLSKLADEAMVSYRAGKAKSL